MSSCVLRYLLSDLLFDTRRCKDKGQTCTLQDMGIL